MYVYITVTNTHFLTAQRFAKIIISEYFTSNGKVKHEKDLKNLKQLLLKKRTVH